jgi:dihydrofolate reductase
MQMSLDGFVAGPEGQLDWMTWNSDKKLQAFIEQLADDSDMILMGRKMSPGFINYWENVVDNQKDSPEFAFAEKMVDMPKIIFSRSQKEIKGRSARMETGNPKDVITTLKKQNGKDIIVYGGAGFVSSLILENLIDDYFLFTNPTAIGRGMSIFSGPTGFKLIVSTEYECGIVVNHYRRT